MPADEMQVNQDTNPSEGYCIKIEVLPGGFTLSDNLPAFPRKFPLIIPRTKS